MGDDEPTIRSAAPPATKNARPTPKAGSVVPTGDPFVFWDKYFKVSNETPAQLQQTVAEILNDKTDKDPEATLKRFKNVEAAIKFYIKHHGKQAEPWMYEWLVKAIEVRKGTPDEIKMAIAYASVLAKKTKNPTDLIRVADMMVLRNYYGSVGPEPYQTNIGELVDQAAQILPANIIPPMMSVNLAVKTKDPNRMGDAADRLLALGWPGIDDKIRADLDGQVNLLKQTLQDEGKTVEAEALGKRIEAAKVRDLYVSLKWTGDADIDLAVDEPLGGTAEYRTPRTVFGGAILKNGYGKHTEEIYVCPRAFNGSYTIRTNTIFNDEAKPTREATLTVITQEGGPEEKRQEYKVNLDKPSPVVVTLTEGRRKEVLPFIAPPEPPPLTVPGAKAARPAPKDNKTAPR